MGDLTAEIQRGRRVEQLRWRQCPVDCGDIVPAGFEFLDMP